MNAKQEKLVGLMAQFAGGHISEWQLDDGVQELLDDEGIVVAVREDGSHRIEADDDRAYDLAKENGEL